MSLEQIAVLVSLIAGLAGLISGIGAWMGGVRVLKHQVSKLEQGLEKIAEAQDTGLAIRVTQVEKWIADTGNADEVREWGFIKRQVPKNTEGIKELTDRITELERNRQ